mmetsp:Transcript_94054/g.210818  ORF Transcript_94054/g.210818 Transcript_94054/m.210818 type:complete len:264 (-) Transcript_94054:1052-1843(-)
MDKPKPKPSKRRLSVWSSCSNGRKMVSFFWGAMPMPVSDTATVRNSLTSSAQAVTTTCPRSVNLRALVMRLYNICVQRCASASMIGKSLGTLLKSCTVVLWIGRPALSTAHDVSMMTSSTILEMWTGSLDSFIRLLCTRVDRSMMLVTKSSSLLAQLLIISIDRCILPFSWVSASKLSLKPMMPCKGDRSSCVTVAANCDFLTSSSLMWVMSCPMQITPWMFPEELMCGAALNRKVTASFVVVSTSTSKFGVDWPAKASQRTR